MLSVLQVGEIRVADDSDFRKLKNLDEDTDNWKLEYQKNNTSVWTKTNEVSSFKIVKVRTTFDDIAGETLYDVLHDPEYRKAWDHSMLEGYEICAINPNNDIGYYALKSPPPLRNRDFVTQRSWLDMGKEKWIINHSVNHESVPPRKGYIRGISYLTGYLIRQQGQNKCQFTYVSQSDPRGKLPVWVVNKATKILAPKIISRIQKACKGYPSWKSKNNPHLKPWMFPEQMTLPRLDMSQIKPLAAGVSSESLDESGINEDEVDAEEYVND
ncbi:START domain-containing protein 10-like [Ruditapes philippinarum]|uniref:START domain-containing protein 10-like n=1 Tax=Ruditapes philippinarum TaxID=129788 RepID=UPI00295B3B8E|nr:START domain-containing protein 10-like [Ruditapes philippinarum]